MWKSICQIFYLNIVIQISLKNEEFWFEMFHFQFWSNFKTIQLSAAKLLHTCKPEGLAGAASTQAPGSASTQMFAALLLGVFSDIQRNVGKVIAKFEVSLREAKANDRKNLSAHLSCKRRLFAHLTFHWFTNNEQYLLPQYCLNVPSVQRQGPCTNGQSPPFLSKSWWDLEETLRSCVCWVPNPSMWVNRRWLRGKRGGECLWYRTLWPPPHTLAKEREVSGRDKPCLFGFDQTQFWMDNNCREEGKGERPEQGQCPLPSIGWHQLERRAAKRCLWQRWRMQEIPAFPQRPNKNFSVHQRSGQLQAGKWTRKDW